MAFYTIAAFIFVGALFEVCLAIANKGASRQHSMNMKLGYASLFIFLMLFCGLRGEGVDRDYPEYLSILKQIPPFPDVMFSDLSDVHGDPILYFIASIINFLGASSYILFLAFSVLSLSLYWRCFLKFSYLPWLSVFIYFCHSFLNKEMTQIRNGLSSAFFLLLLCYVGDKKNIKSIAACSLSFLAHSLGLVSILIMLCKRVASYKNNIYYIGLILSIAMYYFWYSLFLMLPQNLAITQSVALYLSWETYNYSLSLVNPILLRQLCLFFIFLYIKKNYFWNETLDIFLFSYFLSICSYIIFNDTAILGARISNIFSCAEYILIPHSIFAIIKGRNVLMALLMFLGVSLLSMALLYVNLEVKDIFSDYNTVLF